RKITTAGTIATVAGSGNPGFSGDGGLATRALFSGTFAVAVDAQGTIFVTDRFNARVRAVNPKTGIVETVAGGGSDADGIGTETAFVQPEALVALDPALFPVPAGAASDALQLLIVDSRDHRIRRLTYGFDSQGNVDATTATTDTVCGTQGVSGYTGDF